MQHDVLKRGCIVFYAPLHSTSFVVLHVYSLTALKTLTHSLIDHSHATHDGIIIKTHKAQETQQRQEEQRKKSPLPTCTYSNNAASIHGHTIKQL